MLARKKFKIFLKKPVFEFVNAVKQFGYLVEPYPYKIESPDLKDNYLFQLAFTTKAIIVTGDKQLLNWKMAPVRVISLSNFKANLIY